MDAAMLFSLKGLEFRDAITIMKNQMGANLEDTTEVSIQFRV